MLVARSLREKKSLGESVCTTKDQDAELSINEEKIGKDDRLQNNVLLGIGTAYLEQAGVEKKQLGEGRKKKEGKENQLQVNM